MTAPLNNFWSNALVLINENNHPLLIWGKYPAELISNNYGIYVKYGSLAWARRFSLTNEFYKWDLDIFISNQNTVTPYQYKIGVEPSDFVVYTNTEQVLVGGADPAKLATSKVISFDYSLAQNYPNPFNPSTVITFTNKSQEYVELKVYDVLGRAIRTLLNQEMEPGEHKVTFDAGNLPSGIYFYNIKAGEYTATHKMILMK